MFSDKRLEEIFKIIDSYGFTVSVSSKARFSYYDADDKKLVLSLLDDDGEPHSNYTYLVTSLLHEARHLIHDKTGLFKQYYRTRKMDFIVAVAAERDCDVFAINYVRRHFSEKFPITQNNFPYFCNGNNDFKWLKKHFKGHWKTYKR